MARHILCEGFVIAVLLLGAATVLLRLCASHENLPKNHMLITIPSKILPNHIDNSRAFRVLPTAACGYIETGRGR